MKRGGTGVGVGMSSILMVFVLLCLTTFSTLSLVSAGADHRLTTRAARTLSDYYEADAEAERLLAELSDVLRESRAATTEATYRQRYAQLAADLSHPVAFDGATASFSLAVGEAQTLEVVLVLPYGEDVLYRTIQWQMMPLNWQSEEDSDGVNIWGGEFDVMPMF